MALTDAELREVTRWVGEIDQIEADLDERLSRLGSTGLVALEVLMERQGGMAMNDADVRSGDDRSSHAQNFGPIAERISQLVAWLTRDDADELTGDGLALVQAVTETGGSTSVTTFTVDAPTPSNR